jgi:hypothetical protein
MHMWKLSFRSILALSIGLGVGAVLGANDAKAQTERTSICSCCCETVKQDEESGALVPWHVCTSSIEECGGNPWNGHCVSKSPCRD